MVPQVLNKFYFKTNPENNNYSRCMNILEVQIRNFLKEWIPN